MTVPKPSVDEVEVEDDPEDHEDEAPKELADVGMSDVLVDAESEITAPQRVIVEAVQVQRKAVQRSHKKAAKMKRHADSLHVAVRVRRLHRLDSYAKKQGWSVLKAPPEAVRDARLKGWWQEWQQLKKVGLKLR